MWLEKKAPKKQAAGRGVLNRLNRLRIGFLLVVVRQRINATKG